MDPVVLKHRRTTLERAEKFISTRYFTDVNLRGRLYPKTCPVTLLTHWAAPKDRYTPYTEVCQKIFTTCNIGQQFGPTWATHWFKIVIDIPAEWAGSEVRLRWNSGSEALVWVKGQATQGLCSEYDRLDFPLTECVQINNLRFEVYIEMACNGMFGAGDNGMITPPDLNKQFTLSCCEVAVFDRRVYNLLRDVELLYDLAKHLPEGSERGYQALYTVNDVINACDVHDTVTFDRCHKIANTFLKQKNGDSQHTTYAMGHAHIDTAWLWPYSETKRKCARSWSCTLQLMDKYPDFTFTCSQAQQYEWVKEQYPGLYEKIRKYVKEGRFIPVGGTWVEMDGLIPSGEAFIRQFLYGQRFFQKEFGITCKEFWLPDTFGYSGQLPQIMNHCGITRFLTQKMSWSLVNKFPHHTFYWEGIDNSSVLAHFPPGDSYEMKGTVDEHHTFYWEGIDSSQVLAHFPPGNDYSMKGTVDEVLRTVSNFKDKGRSNKTAFLFGYGDGGNGPSEDMLERLTRMKDIDGLPKVKMSTPDDFFSQIEKEDSTKLCKWVGELYLELHNGTYTTHAKVKEMNRRCECQLHDAEFINTVAMVTQKKSQFTYPSVELLRLWKLLMLNQFHDVLPGTSIGMVYKDAHQYYTDIMKSGLATIMAAEKSIGNVSNESADSHHVIWNTQSFDRSEVISVSRDNQDGGQKKKQKLGGRNNQTDFQGNDLCFVNVASYGFSELKPLETKGHLSVKFVGDGTLKMQNACLEATIDETGRVVEMFVAGSDRNLIDTVHPANQFIMHDDIPLYWDAWDVMDYHLETRKPVVTVIKKPEIVENGPFRGAVKFELKISDKSHICQTIYLDVECPYLKFDTQIEWYENRKLLKVEFPTSLHTREATYDIQCGHIKRPNHVNTSWDSARFEVCGHKWSDLSEYGYGLALLNNSKYGHSAVGNTLRMSLLRSPKAPDKTADMETHVFTYAMMPHKGSLQESGVIKESYCLNNPLLLRQWKCEPVVMDTIPRSCFSMATPQVVLETVKKAEDGDNKVILRFYESFGGHCSTHVNIAFKFGGVAVCNGIEQNLPTTADNGLALHRDGQRVHFKLKPFQILTLKIISI